MRRRGWKHAGPPVIELRLAPTARSLLDGRSVPCAALGGRRSGRHEPEGEM
jgi:hypothetical protein